MVEYYKLALSKYAEFTGRSRRSEYWYFVLGNLLVYLALAAVGTLLGALVGGGETAMFLMIGLIGLFGLAIFVPSLAVAIRRLHDTGRSGWWYLIVLVPYVGGIVLIVFMCLDSQPGANKWGPNPKTGATFNDVTSHLVD
ncbi:DUF805 domain-containing protein [Neolewinella lacunae]|uniref:DUF805 domain-containing protein n=1 Tax=Neolewinella lacunae TaxID=1517758 RepID=A0A923PNE9_9BACT|nr:DUF805 domain-containing protein [Neolewinella lacunae]MBC6994876.1 DUF805 domain-containing protein [Neolewinella lacunae]MDN3636796.1 DUF805 domain-containing protein [Neolewinella lacunae]